MHGVIVLCLVTWVHKALTKNLVASPTSDAQAVKSKLVDGLINKLNGRKLVAQPVHQGVTIPRSPFPLTRPPFSVRRSPFLSSRSRPIAHANVEQQLHSLDAVVGAPSSKVEQEIISKLERIRSINTQKPDATPKDQQSIVEQLAVELAAAAGKAQIQAAATRFESFANTVLLGYLMVGAVTLIAPLQVARETALAASDVVEVGRETGRKFGAPLTAKIDRLLRQMFQRQIAFARLQSAVAETDSSAQDLASSSSMYASRVQFTLETVHAMRQGILAEADADAEAAARIKLAASRLTHELAAAVPPGRRGEINMRSVAAEAEAAVVAAKAAALHLFTLFEHENEFMDPDERIFAAAKAVAAAEAQFHEGDQRSDVTPALAQALAATAETIRNSTSSTSQLQH